jgi:hypothetical protein
MGVCVWFYDGTGAVCSLTVHRDALSLVKLNPHMAN